MALAQAQIFGGGLGMQLATTGDPYTAALIQEVTKAGMKIYEDLIESVARAIRKEMADAWNKGQSGGGG